MKSIRSSFPVPASAAQPPLFFKEWTASRRNTVFALFSAALVALAPIHKLIGLSLGEDHSSYVALIPFISGVLIFRNRKQIFQATTNKGVFPGTALLILGGLLCYSSRAYGIHMNDNDYVGLAISGVIASWLGAFLVLYGSEAFKAGAFPLLFLGLTIPIPSQTMSEIVRLLQHGSASLVSMLFILTGTPAYRISDVVFALPGLTIEVAEACSGIRSTLGIFIVTTLAAYLSLRSKWKRTILVLLVIPVSLLKNAVRIVTLSLLAIHLDMSFITGNLHHEGGIFFMMFGLCLMYPVLVLLMRSEEKEFKIGVRS